MKENLGLIQKSEVRTQGPGMKPAVGERWPWSVRVARWVPRQRVSEMYRRCRRGGPSLVEEIRVVEWWGDVLRVVGGVKSGFQLGL